MWTALTSGAMRPLILVVAFALALPVLGCSKKKVKDKDTKIKTSAAIQKSKGIGVVNCHACLFDDDEISFDLEDDDLDGLTDAEVISVTFYGCDLEDLTFDAVGSAGSLYKEETCTNSPCLKGYEEFTGLTNAAVSSCDSYALTLNDGDGNSLTTPCAKTGTAITCS